MNRILLWVHALLPWTGFCQKDPSKPYDSLDKYSYLIIGVRVDPNSPATLPFEERLQNVEYSTGFFIRTATGLYLVSAFHVFTDCEVYAGVFQDVRAEFLAVCYTDTLGKSKRQLLPLTYYRSKACRYFWDQPDVDTMNVTDYFKDACINSIEQLLPPLEPEQKRMAKGKKFICFGYPADKSDEYFSKNGDFPRHPCEYIRQQVNDSRYGPRISSMYVVITPLLVRGTSGAPLFRVMRGRKRREFIQFAGIQSGSNNLYNHSLIVRPSELMKLLN